VAAARDWVPPEELDDEKAALVYQAILRAFLLEVLDPQAWVDRMTERVPLPRLL
jgi:hypothetical protein